MTANTQTTPESETVWEGTSPQLMARLVGYDAANVEQADISAISYTVYDILDLDTEVNGSTLTVADVIFDTLQTDSRWTKDTTGYNFRHQLPAAAIPTGSKVYTVQYKFTDTSGAFFYLEFQLETRNQLFD